MKTLTIITPTYNRAKLLKQLYESLRHQSEFDFEWLIIDDGSTDNTKKEILEFKKDLFNIRYYYQKNSGKHIALNKAFSKLMTSLALIVDSDDTLTNDAVATIIKRWEKYKDDPKVCGLVFRKADKKGQIIGRKFPRRETTDNYSRYIINKGITGDKAEIFRAKILKKYRFPEFKNEKFLGEGVLWSQIAQKYDMVFIEKSIYICEYLPDGLTNSGRKIRIQCPLGGMYHSEEFLRKDYNLKIRVKNGVLYLTYARFAHENIRKLIRNSKHRHLLFACVIPSAILWNIWRKNND